MKRKSKIFLLIIFIVIISLYTISFINQRNTEEKFFSKMPDEVLKISKDSLEYLLNGETELLLNLFVDEYRNSPNSLDEINGFIKQFEDLNQPLNMDLIGYYININNGFETHKVTYQLKFENNWFIYNATIARTIIGYELYRFDFNGIEESLLKTNSFSFKNKGITNFVVLFLDIFIMLFTIITSALCFGSNGKKRLLWTFLVFCGIGLFTLNWTTGAFHIRLISIGLPTFGVGRTGSYGPIKIYFRIPLFAIIYWIKKIKQKNGSQYIESNIVETEKVDEFYE